MAFPSGCAYLQMAPITGSLTAVGTDNPHREIKTQNRKQTENTLRSRSSFWWILKDTADRKRNWYSFKALQRHYLSKKHFPVLHLPPWLHRIFLFKKAFFSWPYFCTKQKNEWQAFKETRERWLKRNCYRGVLLFKLRIRKFSIISVPSIRISSKQPSVRLWCHIWCTDKRLTVLVLKEEHIKALVMSKELETALFIALLTAPRYHVSSLPSTCILSTWNTERMRQLQIIPKLAY